MTRVSFASVTVDRLVRGSHLNFWRVLLSSCLAFLVLGCGQQSETVNDVEPKPPLRVQGPLRVLIVDDEELGVVLEREWRASSEHAIEIDHVGASDLLASVQADSKKLDTDIVIFPSAMLGTLAERKLLRPAPRELASEPSYRYGEIFDLVRRRETHWGAQPYAVSFGSPTLVLLRRADLVPNAPETWEDLNREVARLTEGGLPDAMTALAQPLADGWAARVFLSRAAGYLYDSSKVSGVFNYATMEPRIASDPFVRALEEMLADCADGFSFDLTPATSLQAFVDGRAAMAITWASAIPAGDGGDAALDSAKVSDLPRASRLNADSGGRNATGSNSVTLFGIDGRMGAVSRAAKNAALANIFLAWATGPQDSAMISSRSAHTAPFRSSHQAVAGGWTHPRLPASAAEEYARTVQESLCRSRAFQCLRIPGYDRYLRILDEKVLQVLHRRQQVRPALDEVADRWAATTDELGVSRQIAAYRLSLGIETN